jgi:hypothetical protein
MTLARSRNRLPATFVASALLACACLVATLFPAMAGGNRTPAALVSTSPTGGNGTFPALFMGASVDGTRVVFRTTEQLSPSDTDTQFDLYERAGSNTTILTVGPNGGNGDDQGFYRGASADGSRVFFDTSEALVSSDTDIGCGNQDGKSTPCNDVYQNAGGSLSVLSVGPTGGNGTFSARYRGASDDGTHVFFTTKEHLVSADTDSATDVYERASGQTYLVSTGSAGGNGAFEPTYRGATSDGLHVFFETAEPLTASDTDSSTDVYDRSGGQTVLISGGSGAFGASYRGASKNGSHVFFETNERLSAQDTDSSTDVYDRSGAQTTLVSTGAVGGNGAQDALFEGASADGSRVFFDTRERLAGPDTDNSLDVYERSSGQTTLLSTGSLGGNGAFDASYQGSSTDGSHVFIGTNEALAAGDADSRFDVYDRSNAQATLLTTGRVGVNGAFDAFFRDASDDGSRVFFETAEPLTADDTDSLTDLYEHTDGVTARISVGAGSESSVAVFVGATADGNRVFLDSGDKLASTDTDSVADVYVVTVSSGFARPKGATPMKLSLVIAYKQCTNPNRFHGPPPLSTNPVDQSCYPPLQASDYLTVGTLDSNGQKALSVGSARFDVIPGNSNTPADEADVSLSFSMTDVRKKSDLSDYGGELLATTSIRMTDKLNGSAPVDPGTASDLSFSYGVPCAMTTDTGVGSTCATSTTADSLVPGAIVEGGRSIWEIGQLQVLDGGADGDADTAPNTLFADEGYFVP